jgi:hypothetical protein
MSQNQYFLGPWSQIPKLTIATSPVTASHTGIPSPTSASHVGYWSETSASHVEDQKPAAASHAGGITLVTMNHLEITSPASASHVESMPPTIVNGIGGIHMVEKPIHVRRKPKFLCRICEGDYLTRLFPTTDGIPEVWSSPMGPSGSELYLVSQHSVSPLIDMTIMSVKSSPEHTPIFGGDASLDLVVSHPIQPMVEKVIAPKQFSVDLALLVLVLYLLYHVLNISSQVTYEQERVLLSPSTLPPSLGEVPFDWDGLVGYPMPPPMPFQVRDIIQYIVEKVTSTSTLSSSAWRVLGFSKLVSAIRKMLTFHRSSAWETWPPP